MSDRLMTVEDLQRVTDPNELLTSPELLGPVETADGAVTDAIEGTLMVMCAWGAHSAAPARAAKLTRNFGNWRVMWAAT